MLWVRCIEGTLGAAAVTLPALLPAPAFLYLVLPRYSERLSKAFLQSQGITSSPCPQVSVLSGFFCLFVYILFYFLSLSNFVLNRKWSDLLPPFFELRGTLADSQSCTLSFSGALITLLFWAVVGKIRQTQIQILSFPTCVTLEIQNLWVEWNNNSACLVGLSGVNIGGFLGRVLGTQYDVNVS